MTEHDALIDSYEHLPNEKREKDALQILRKIASLVKPIMRNHSWRVGTLAEFYPEQQNLLGLNVNRGEKICLRLRYPGDKQQFLPLESIVGTMLHELTHNVYGPHDDKFKALNNKLRDEYDALIRKGYTGEGFLGKGHRVGGRRIPMHEMRRQAHLQAEKRRNLQKGSGQRLGSGKDVRTDRPQALSPRDAAALAAIRRDSMNDKCGSNGKDAKKIADQTSRNTRKTRADTGQENDEVLQQQALWDLIRQEEAGKAGVSDWNDEEEGLNWDPESGLNLKQGSSTSNHERKQSSTQKESTVSHSTRHHNGSSSSTAPPRQPRTETMWSCPICTLVNPSHFLCCDACGIERPYEIIDNDSPNPSPDPSPSRGQRLSHTSKDTATDKPPSRVQTAPPHQPKAAPRLVGWECRRCGAFMEHKWWTCSGCGLMKESSAI